MKIQLEVAMNKVFQPTSLLSWAPFPEVRKEDGGFELYLPMHEPEASTIPEAEVAALFDQAQREMQQWEARGEIFPAEEYLLDPRFRDSHYRRKQVEAFFANSAFAGNEYKDRIKNYWFLTLFHYEIVEYKAKLNREYFKNKSIQYQKAHPWELKIKEINQLFHGYVLNNRYVLTVSVTILTGALSSILFAGVITTVAFGVIGGALFFNFYKIKGGSYEN